MRPQGDFDWLRLLADRSETAPIVDSRRRLRMLLAAFVLALSGVLARAAWLEVTSGPEVRAAAAKPRFRTIRLPAPRGKIAARDGTILAHDQRTCALALNYRYIEQPPQPSWLRNEALGLLSRTERKDARAVQFKINELRVARAEMQRQLAALAGVSLARWNQSRRQIQSRVERVADSVNRRTRQQNKSVEETAPRESTPWSEWIHQAVNEALFADPRPLLPRRITVAEELSDHIVVDELSEAAAHQIEAHPEQFPGAKVVWRERRHYPQGERAAHLVGHLGRLRPDELAAAPGRTRRDRALSPDDLVGRLGIEKVYESGLRGRAGYGSEQIDGRGRVQRTLVDEPPHAGVDVVLSIDVPLQAAAEQLLDAAVRRLQVQRGESSIPVGGAAILMDAQHGEILACAAAPRFDPNVVLRGDPAAIGHLFSSVDRPMFDRAVRMAIPPGSVMKAITAVALLETGFVDPAAPFSCRGYLLDPSRRRCAVFRQFGVGHGEITLAGALAQSCNVFFFHHARRMGDQPLVAWAQRFGLGKSTGVELISEARGNLPRGESSAGPEDRPWRTADTEDLAIGQGRLTATPLQIVRAMAAIGTGRLVTPRLVLRCGNDRTPPDSASLALGVNPQTWQAVRDGLRLTVADPQGTAHRTLDLPQVAIAAKTGTAQAGRGREDHAWIAGYAPADAPRIAFVVVLEHGGSGAQAAGPVARRLIKRAHELGYFAPTRLADRTR